MTRPQQERSLHRNNKFLDKIRLGGACEKLSGVTTDGARAMTGTRVGASDQID